MLEATTSRRDVMRALAIVPAAIAAPAVANAAATNGGVSPGMAAAIEAYRKASAAEDAFNHAIYDPAVAAWREAVEGIPHYATEAHLPAALGEAPRPMRTDNPSDLTMARMYQKLTVDGYGLGRDETALKELVERLEQREAEKQRLGTAHNIYALQDESERLAEIRTNAMFEVEAQPAHTLADLIAKTEFIKETDGDTDHDELLADLRRISGKIAA